MTTVTSDPDTSLIYWDQNSNRSNVSADRFNGDPLVLKDNFLNVFSKLASELKAKTLSKFIPLWKEVIHNEEKILRVKITAAVPGITESDLEKIIAKFQGNCGEIFAEKFFRSGLGAEVCKPESYSTVDPHHEEGTDAAGISPISNLKIGIQIKNYLNSQVPLEVFRTAGDESDKYVHALNKDQFEDFLRCPNQYVFSFGGTLDVLKEEYENRVRFLGPSYIESKGFCGKKGDKCGNWTFFQDIADEIRRLQ